MERLCKVEIGDIIVFFLLSKFDLYTLHKIIPQNFIISKRAPPAIQRTSRSIELIQVKSVERSVNMIDGSIIQAGCIMIIYLVIKI